MILRKLAWLALLSLLILSLATIGSSMAAGNTIPLSGLGASIQAITANSLKPAACAGINVSTIVRGSGTINGTSNNDLILGSPGQDRISGGAGSDCILGGGGNDDIRGNAGTNICIGGPGFDVFTGCNTQVQ
jgi:Ca2+-binding RTX toxin-like protein